MKYTLLAAAVIAVIAPKVQSTTPYTLEELGNLDNAKHGYVTDMNELGQAVGVASIPFDIPIELSTLDFEDDAVLISAYNTRKEYFERIDKEITFTLDDIENDIINGDAQEFLQDFLRDRYTNSKYQKISRSTNSEFNLAVIYNNSATEKPIFDEPRVFNENGNEVLTRSVENIFTAISEDGVKVGWGSAPYETIDFTKDDELETHYKRDYTRRGFIIKNTGELITLGSDDPNDPDDIIEYGGISIATDIIKVDDGYIISGEDSVSIAPESQELLDENCDGENLPEQVCEEAYVTSSRNPLYNRHATLWYYDNELTYLTKEDLGIGITPDENESDKAWRSIALAVNQNEIAVGYSVVRFRDGDSITTYPVYFQDGNVVEFIDEELYRPGGNASAINIENILTGYAVKNIEGTNRNKFYYHDISTGETVFPTDFFQSSSSVANDINDNGLIVGQGEVETSSSSNRRREGFLYDINKKTFTNINSLLPCFSSDDDGFPYVVAEAIGINNDGTIYGAATKTVDKRDAQGHLVVDSNGNPEQESIVVPVKLTFNPNGDAETCPDREEETYQRQGASTNLLWFLLPLFVLRRRFFK